MTLVELLAASALAVSLMTATLGVISSLAVQRRTLLGDGSVEPWRRQLVEQLRWDFGNARKMRVRRNALHLIGYGGVDFETGQPTHRPTEIVYSVDESDGHSWLLRKEIHLDANTLHNSRSEIAAAGVTAIDAYDLDKDDEDRDRTSPNDPDTPSVSVPVPDRLRIVLYGEDEDKPILDEQIVLR